MNGGWRHEDFAACPECGCTDWIRFNSGGFVCNGCGRLIFTEEMILKGEDDDEVGNGG